jgi:hypothetical protein
MHMRQAFRVARANEAEANDIVDKIQHELFEASSELQDCKQAMKENVGMFVDMRMQTPPKGLFSLASSTVVDSGGRSEEDSDDDSVDIYTGPTSLCAMKIRKEENKEEEKEEKKEEEEKKIKVQVVVQEVPTDEEEEKPEPVLEQPKVRDGHRFVQRTLLSHLGISGRPSKLATSQ